MCVETILFRTYITNAVIVFLNSIPPGVTVHVQSVWWHAQRCELWLQHGNVSEYSSQWPNQCPCAHLCYQGRVFVASAQHFSSWTIAWQEISTCSLLYFLQRQLIFILLTSMGRQILTLQSNWERRRLKTKRTTSPSNLILCLASEWKCFVKSK